MTVAAPITAKHRRRSPKAPSKAFIHLPSPGPTPTINRIQRTPTPVKSPSTLKLHFFKIYQRNPLKGNAEFL
ncbi:hypothetical protein COLO4_24617 [Corchorus olitorius]|uniref:Uncharacterized protein n=1 Tax=Corchorus olitorius TaxID=93759 RepID=A0A1R3I8S7_9ROSI|nr:hypothetical protein COLO4_24617 [Corchorus olitorius]